MNGQQLSISVHQRQKRAAHVIRIHVAVLKRRSRIDPTVRLRRYQSRKMASSITQRYGSSDTETLFPQ